MTWRSHLLRIRPWLVFALLPAILVAAGSAAFTSTEPRQFTADSELYVQQAANSGVGPSVDIYASQELAATYARMVTNGPVLQAANSLLQRTYPGYNIEARSVAAVSQMSSQLIDISLTDTNPKRAAYALNTLTITFIKYVRGIELQRFSSDQATIRAEITAARNNINHVTSQLVAASNYPARESALKGALSAYEASYQSLLSQLEQFDVSRDAMVNSLSISFPAQVHLTGPSPFRSAVLFGSLTFLLCGALVYLYFYLDDSLRRPEEVEEAAGAPVLGTVENFGPHREGEQLITVTKPRSAAAESYRMLRTNLQFANIDKPLRTLVVTSAAAAEGKSTTASNLARVFAESGQPVTLVDADLRRPSLHRIFELPTRQHGLTNMLISPALNGDIPQPGGHSGLSIVASGPLPPNPADLLGSERMHRVIEHLQSESRIVIVDSPPVLSAADAAVLATFTDGVLIVVNPRRCKRRELIRTRRAIEAVGGRIIGVMINGLTSSSGYYYHYANHYHYNDDFRYNPPTPSIERHPPTALRRE